MNMAPNSYFMLSMRYQSPVVTLEQVIKDYFTHLQLEEANRRAAKVELPFPAFKAEKSRKAPWLVNISDLASYLDKQRQSYAEDFATMHK